MRLRGVPAAGMIDEGCRDGAPRLSADPRKDGSVNVNRLAVSAALVAALGVTAADAQAQPPAAVDTSTLGPQVGATVPPVSGTDQFGKAQTLQSLSGPKGLMLVFSRSVDW